MSGPPTAPRPAALRARWRPGRALDPLVRRLSLLPLAATLAVAGVIVLSPGAPSPRGQSTLHLWAAVWRLGGAPPTFLSFGTVEFAANVLMFLPLGLFGAAAVAPRWRLRLVPVAAAGSVAVEIAQLFIPERVSSLSDVVADTLGALLGVLLLVRLSERRPVAVRR